MKLEKTLEQLNSFEKNSFLKIVNDIVSDNPKNIKEIDKILSDNMELKNMDNINISRVFGLVQDEYSGYLRNELLHTSSNLDVLADLLIRDGNCIMKQDWFSKLYELELKNLNLKVKELKKSFESDKSELEESRKRDYKIYKSCLETAYFNDDDSNSERKITDDELSILITLSNELELSQEEIKLINYMIIPIEKLPIESVINELKNSGVLFYSKKNNIVYIADEVVRVLRKIRGKEIADKYSRRILRLLKDSQINMIARKHNINWKMSLEDKIKEIIKEGISFTGIMSNDIYKEGTKILEKKKVINELCDKKLKIQPSLKGITIENKISNLIKYFENIEKDEKVGISIDGYDKLLIDLNETLPKLNDLVKKEFEHQDEKVLNSKFLLDFNIKPTDILELIDLKSLENFCKKRDIKTRGDLITNILSAYKDSENIYLENFENIGFRNLSALKGNGIIIKEADLGVKFEDLTKTIFNRLGFDVAEKLRKSVNTKKDKIDVLLRISEDDVILVECKSSKESGYNKFSSVSRQMKAYANLLKTKDFKVIKVLLIAPDFSDDFIHDCEVDYDLNLSLIKASSLLSILEGFKKTKHKELPYKLLMRDVLIQESRILKAIGVK